ncbi:octopamine receptor Oamb isoform X3 [Frankliniella occidentalis]|uniref:Octopamine receptor Oamb isoform X3 n=1 Tax=Frankliniella occidentalis TaxID=133901 RepID=A0A9C6X3K7_FRAOC|nr:octopamine receptor Oamb isoform X3 [Frankliniella occidentalis]
MNESECAALLESADWHSPRLIVVFVILGVVNVMVILGNLLVIAAVYISSKLRTVTNLFIVSLAVADLLVGVAVLPFSSTLEVSKVWIFGDVWCSMWLAVDVWMCTASILNLCAISLDRYLAVTRPVTYPSLMSNRRARWLIFVVWVLSFVICFPPLVGWKDRGPAALDDTMLGGTQVRGRGVGGLPPALLGSPGLVRSTPRPATTEAAIILAATNETDLEMSLAATTAEWPTEWPAEWPGSDYSAPAAAVTPELDALAPALAPALALHADVEALEGVGGSRPRGESWLRAEGRSRCPWVCELTNDTGYVLYSAFGSFFIPCFVMLFFYWRIYRAAVQTTRAINQGFRTTKGSRKFGNRFDEQRLTLRIHRGRGSVRQRGGGAGHSAPSTTSTTAASSAANSLSGSPGKSPDSLRVQRASIRRGVERSRTFEKIKISVSYPSCEAISSHQQDAEPHPAHANNNNGTATQHGGPLSSPNASKKSSFSSASSPTGPGGAIALNVLSNGASPTTVTAVTTPTGTTIHRPPSSHLKVTPQSRLSQFFLSVRRRRSSTESECARESSDGHLELREFGRDMTPSPTFEEQGNKPKLISKMGKRNIKAQVKRFRMETKAAKTLGIIVGGFICCWMPFFTMYLVRAFCPECINPTVFSVLFWLGYCNSAINPCIYALFSNDFRFAFKRIICRCLCGAGGRKSSQRSNQTRRGSDGSQLGVRGANASAHHLHAGLSSYASHSGGGGAGGGSGASGLLGAGAGAGGVGGGAGGGVSVAHDQHLPHCAQHPANASRAYGLLAGDDSDLNNGSDSR